MCILGEHDQVEVIIIADRFASLAPTEVGEVLKLSVAIKLLSGIERTILNVHVDIARHWVRRDLPRLV